MSAPVPAALPAARSEGEDHGHHADGMIKLAVGAIGIVFGDIGTSPLYAFRETFAGHHQLALDPLHIMGVLSLMFWSMMIVVTIKYVAIIMRADNKGEGGSLALLALVSGRTKSRRWSTGIILLGVFATSLFYGDSMITPAVTVLSAVEGLAVAAPAFGGLVLPIVIAILIALFWVQKSGTARIGLVFGPIMLVYFAVIAVLGLISVVQTPEVLWAFSPHHAVEFFLLDPVRAFLALGSVVLAVTGAEALYADMGHFGRKPIGLSWLVFVLPALMCNYLGQGALLFREGQEALRSPFYMLAPDSLQLPLVILATMAAIIASQAVISGAFSVTQQAIQLGFMPRLRIEHTSAATAGQIYIPLVNWMLMVMVILLVLFFRTSSNLTSAYGIAVTGAMFIDTCLLGVALTRLWNWPLYAAAPLLAVFFLVDGAYFSANLTKVPDGGWFPLMVGFIVFTFLTTWSKGRKLMMERLHEAAMPIKVFITSAANSASRVPGTAVFMTSSADGVPHALLHNLKHNKVLHERVILLTVKIVAQPYWPEAERAMNDAMGEGFYRLVLRYGFMEEVDVPAALKRVHECGADFKMMDTSFFLSRQTLLPSERPGMMLWREKLFAWMLRNAESAMEFFRLPTNRVVELGSQVEI
ncbi:KUP system potassium uptake protein [Sphingomonas insulae]|uniref:Probable potassium transport system protein Kup n=1 Tax=Sphingomonas insulae TaxID=424800 RepID=A0ABP3T3H4_9SPHN|nr:potassium transporter Kup [Sphingomonas insulae]NIJ29545.1 KUP system potassium uptake protein [Sphingomonas insulae]